ncbi:hypothetical protein DRN97_11585 [Methanosarcinales archaeon]|nr:MAG: hypothetical protein DRN97_11585 [Methanosarcinales archaeon]
MKEAMLGAKHKSIRIKELKNYGSSRRPLYTIAVEIELTVSESPDALHKIFTGSGLITRETVPFEVVSNFRGSAGDKTFYSALVVHEGITKKYEVVARDTGGFLRTRIKYEPVVYPEELRLTHPAEFSRMNIEVMEWELHNYKHYFMLLIASKRYESFDMWVKRERGEEEAPGFTSIKVNLTESELREKKAPCSWYLKRVSVFEGIDMEEEVRRKIEVG